MTSLAARPQIDMFCGLTEQKRWSVRAENRPADVVWYSVEWNIVEDKVSQILQMHETIWQAEITDK